MKQAVVFTGNRFPDGDAGSIRQLAFSKILKELGYSVFVYGMGTPTNGQVKQYENIDYISYKLDNSSIISRLVRRFVWADLAIKDANQRFERIDAILVIEVLPRNFKQIELLANRKHSVLLHDSVEWYSPEEFKTGVLNYQYILKSLVNKKLINHRWNVIAISKYLYSHFKTRAKKVIRIPVIMDSHMIQANYCPNKDLTKFVYAGSPGNKDYLYNLLQAFILLIEREFDFEIHLAGVTEKDLIDNCGLSSDDLNILYNYLFCHGRVSHDKAIDLVQSADYSLLMRDATLRYAKAGFPTKIVESLMVGTPPLCNYSSDLSLYLTDGCNSIIVEDDSINSIYNSLCRACNLDYKDKEMLRRNARETAERYFDYRRYLGLFKTVLQ